VAKEFAFNQIRRKRSAINFQIWRIAAWAKFMNEACKMIFSAAGFAGDKKRGGRNGDFLRKLKQAERGGRLGDPWKAVGHGLIVLVWPTAGFSPWTEFAERDTEGAIHWKILLVAIGKKALSVCLAKWMFPFVSVGHLFDEPHRQFL
jgi:hypothetical protein